MDKIQASALVIDDQEEMLSLCSGVLAGLVTEVQEASSTAAARAAFHKRTFDLVLTDINIDAQGDGIELAREIRNLAPATIVVIMTAQPSLETAIGGLKTGASAYILKPFSIDYLESVIRSAFEKSRLTAELESEKAFKAEIAAAYAQLQESARLKNAFLGRLNHELRTPLAIALASSELLGREIGDPAGKEVWARSDGALRRLALVIDELLLFSDLLKGEVKLQREDCDLQALLQETSARLKFLYDEMGLSVSFSREGEPGPVNCDPAMLREVFKHLLMNAVKFNKQGGSIAVKSAYSPAKALFTFSDSGGGVDEADMPKLFDNFFQAADYLTREVGGVGLGLATVKRIVEAHGGGVSAHKNAPGPGLTFSFWLPRDAAK